MMLAASLIKGISTQRSDSRKEISFSMPDRAKFANCFGLFNFGVTAFNRRVQAAVWKPCQLVALSQLMHS
jgi:hypothetical protein